MIYPQTEEDGSKPISDSQKMVYASIAAEDMDEKNDCTGFSYKAFVSAIDLHCYFQYRDVRERF